MAKATAAQQRRIVNAIHAVALRTEQIVKMPWRKPSWTEEAMDKALSQVQSILNAPNQASPSEWSSRVQLAEQAMQVAEFCWTHAQAAWVNDVKV